MEMTKLFRMEIDNSFINPNKCVHNDSQTYQLYLCKNEDITDSTLIANNKDYEIFQQIALNKLTNHKNESSPNHFLKLISPGGAVFITYAKNKTIGFADLITILNKYKN